MHQKEVDMYDHVKEWLYWFLKDRYKNREIKAFDTSQYMLSIFLCDQNLQKYFPSYPAYEIKIDITGVIILGNKAELSLVECKAKKITLKDISQLLGYSKVTNPIYSFIVSPKGVSNAVSYLLKTLRRYDILSYSKNRRIYVAKWNKSKKNIVRPTLPPF